MFSLFSFSILQNKNDLNICSDSTVDNEEQLVYLVSNILFTIMWKGVPNDHAHCWIERGQVLACVNLLALNNELITSHLTFRMQILEMAVQTILVDLTENSNQYLLNQMVYLNVV